MHCWEEDKKADVRAQGVLRQRGKRSSHDGLLLGHDGLVVGPAQQIHRGAVPNSFFESQIQTEAAPRWI